MKHIQHFQRRWFRLLGGILISLNLVMVANASNLFVIFSPLTDSELCSMLEEELTYENTAMESVQTFYKSLSEETPQVKMYKLDMFIQKKIQENPEDSKWGVIYAYFCFYRGMQQKCYPVLKKICYELQVQDCGAWSYLASLEWFYGNKENAYRCIYRAIHLDSDDVAALLLLGAFLEQDGKYTESIHYLTQCVNVMENASEGYAYRAVSYIHLGEYSLAARDLEGALNGAWSRNPDCYYYLVGCYLYLNQNDKALDVLSRAIQQFPNESAFSLIRYLIQDRKNEKKLPDELFTPGIRILFKPEKRL